jgi:hypothetical protein
VVGCKLHLDSIFAERALWEVHYGGVVHEDVYGGDFFSVENIDRHFTDRFLAGKVQLEGTVSTFGKSTLSALILSWILVGLRPATMR